MRNSVTLMRRERFVDTADLFLSQSVRDVYLQNQTPKRLVICSELVRWSNRKMFKSTWRVQFARGSKEVYPLSAQMVEGVKEERYFSLLNGCDAQTGLYIGGAKSREEPVNDTETLVKRIAGIYRVGTNPITQANLLRRVLRVRTSCALSLLRAAIPADQLAAATLPHFAAQAGAGRAWFDEPESTLKMVLTGDSIMQTLGIAI